MTSTPEEEMDIVTILKNLDAKVDALQKSQTGYYRAYSEYSQRALERRTIKATGAQFLEKK